MYRGLFTDTPNKKFYFTGSKMRKERILNCNKIRNGGVLNWHSAVSFLILYALHRFYRLFDKGYFGVAQFL